MTPKIEGPYPHGSGFRCRIRTEAGRRWCQAGATEEDALRLAEQDVAQLPEAARPPAQPPEPPRKQPGPLRIYGPYEHGSGFRCRVETSTGSRWCPARSTRDHAWKLAEQIVSLAAAQGQHTVRDAIAAYQDYQRDVKGNRPTSVVTTGHVLHRFFEPMLDHELNRVTPQRGADLYDRFRRTRSDKTGKVPAVDTHRNYLLQARSFFSWCVEQGWVRIHPLAKVKGVGRRSHGKAQLSLDESRRLHDHCLREAVRDDGALAVLIALRMGLRASEIISRTVRDLDDRGRMLRIANNEELAFAPKTRASRRPVPVPVELQPLLLSRTRHKLPGALLFIAENGGPHWRDWPREQVQRFCKDLGLPKVCAHGLRGGFATLATQGGAAIEAVGRALGHESTSMTRTAYVAPGASEQAERDQAGAALRSGR